MKKQLAGLYVLFVAVGASAVAYAANSDAPTISGYGSWIMSLGRKVVAKILGLSGNAVDKAASFISDHEGFVNHAYDDGAGFLTIGYGHKIVDGDGFDSSSTISEPDAWDLMLRDMQPAIDCVNINVSVPLNDNQTAALISLAYNIGCGNFSSSTLLRLLNGGDYAGAASQFSVWIYAGGKQLAGLVSRRADEQAIFLG